MSDHQRVFVMRHGERLDSRDPRWKRSAPRPYDTPLSPRGHSETLRLAKQRLTNKGIEVVLSSPFLRCLQTAAIVCTALELEGVHTCNGLCEALMSGNGMRCQPEVPAMDDITPSSLLNVLTFDPTPLPTYPELVSDVHTRYHETFKRLADTHWPKNIVLVTHEICVRECVRWGGCEEDVEATYCGQVELTRPDQHSHSWTMVEYHGVYKYDSVIE